MTSSGSARNSLVIDAPPEAIYRAFPDPLALATWLAPDDMTGTIQDFDLRAGGGCTMSLFYEDVDAQGKTTGHEDRYTARYVELVPNERIVTAIVFDTTNPSLTGEMTMTVTLGEVDGGTNVTIAFDGIPSGIRPEDNEEGTRQSLASLTRYMAGVE